MKTHSQQIDLYIDEVVLHGFEGLDGAAVRAALQRELARLLAQRSLPSAWTADARIPRLEGNAFTATPGAGALEVGRQVARAVYGGLKR
jgi:hypothetical protein